MLIIASDSLSNLMRIESGAVETVEEAEMVLVLAAAAADFDIVLQKVRGRADVPGNEAADRECEYSQFLTHDDAKVHAAVGA